MTHGRGDLPSPRPLYTTMQTRYREWIQPNSFTEYQTTVESQNLLVASSDALLPPSTPSAARSEAAFTQITTRLQATLVFCRITHPAVPDDLLAVYTKGTSVHFAFDGKPHAQIMELLPRSLETQPLYVSLGANQLPYQYWILPEETFSMGILRRLVSIFQMSVPEGTVAAHRASESDTFGRYIALYQAKAVSKGLRLEKKRTRYLFTPQSSGAHADRPDLTTRDAVTMHWEKWLRQVDADLTTQIHIRKQKVVEERVQLKAQAHKSGALPRTERERLQRMFDPKKRRAVSPWDALEPVMRK
jgi:hypothetical protein